MTRLDLILLIAAIAVSATISLAVVGWLGYVAITVWGWL